MALAALAKLRPFSQFSLAAPVALCANQSESRSRKTMSGRFLGTWICVVLLNATPCAGEVLDFCFRHEHVLGTSLELRIEAPAAEMAAEVERTSLAEIDRLAKALSGYDGESEFMRWQSSE